MYLVKNASSASPRWLVVAYWSKYTTGILKGSKRIVKFLRKGPSILEGVLAKNVTVPSTLEVRPRRWLLVEYFSKCTWSVLQKCKTISYFSKTASSILEGVLAKHVLGEYVGSTTPAVVACSVLLQVNLKCTENKYKNDLLVQDSAVYTWSILGEVRTWPSTLEERPSWCSLGPYFPQNTWSILEMCKNFFTYTRLLKVYLEKTWRSTYLAK